MARLDLAREKRLQPKRMKFAQKVLSHMGYEIKIISENEIQFIHQNETIKLFPYSGWFSGKSVKDRRGIGKLIIQLKASRSCQ